MVNLTLQCLKHKNYKAVRYPSSGCDTCIFIFEIASGATLLAPEGGNALYNLYIGRAS